jgi:hypothetical protein
MRNPRRIALRQRKFVDREALISYIKTLTRNELCVTSQTPYGTWGVARSFLVSGLKGDHNDRQQTEVGWVPQHGTSDELKRKYRACVPPEK